MFALCLCLLFAREASAANQIVSFLSVGDHKCKDDSQTCADDATCCPFGDGYGCCETTTVSSGPCCGEGCCSAFETCCADSEGEACCMQQSTYCVQKDPSFPTLPARCCPRWTVGCDTGSVGCCDPAQPWQWSIAEKRSIIANNSPIVDDFDNSDENIEDGAVAYALMVSGSAKVALSAWTIDISTGEVVAKKSLSSFDDDPAGESTREFLWDALRKKFYYFDANFTADGGSRPTKGRTVYLYSVDPASGTVNKTTIVGAVDFPTGYAMRDDGHILMATEHFEDGNTLSGFDFYDVDPEASTAVLLGTNKRGDSESNPEYYAGYHRSVSADATEVYRFGYEKVTQQQNQGIGITKISLSDNTATTTWKSELSKDHDFFMSLNRYDRNGSSFISLAPNKDSSSRSLDVVQWNLDESIYKVVGSLKNAHPPRVMGGGDLGYLADFVRGDTYAGLVVEDSSLPYGIGDRWALAVGTITSGDSFKVLPLKPRDIAGVLSVSGFGM